MSAHAEPLAASHAAAVDAHDDHGHHDPYLAHHFEDKDQQQEAHSLGMWTFLATEIMFFGGLFVAFTVYHVMFPAAFKVASSELDVFWGGLNTCVLIASSFTMAMGVYSAQTGNQKRLKLYLLITIACAAIFCGVKAIEWTAKYEHHLIPGATYDFFHHQRTGEEAKHLATALQEDPNLGRHTQLFFFLYFCMTGLHGIHVVIGIGIISWIYLRARRGEFSQNWYTPVDLTGLYWHFVDLIWIYLFPLLYLIHRH